PQAKAQELEGEPIYATPQLTIGDALLATDERFAVAGRLCPCIQVVTQRLVAPVALLPVESGQLRWPGSEALKHAVPPARCPVARPEWQCTPHRPRRIAGTLPSGAPH